MIRILNISRRQFLAGTVAAGGLVLGLRYLPGGRESGAPAAVMDDVFETWLSIAPDNTVTLFVGQSEMGQGIFTALPMLIAEELEVDWRLVRAEYAAKVYMTGGSRSIRRWSVPLRQAGATAREMLIAAAAQKWDVPARECLAENGVVYHRETDREITFGEVAGIAARLDPPPIPELKPRDRHHLLGQPVPRLDIPLKVNGSAEFGIDVKLPGMLYAAVRNCPAFGARITGHDMTPLQDMAGVAAVVEVPDGIAVVAHNTWQALKAAEALVLTYSPEPGKEISSNAFLARYRVAAESGVIERDDGDVTAALAGAPKRIAAEYTLPYLAHACMEPLNCTARVTAETCEVWVPTQNQEQAIKTAAKAAGLPEDQVTVHVTFLGGGFGRRGETDIVAQAVTVAKSVGRPVKLTWSREEDTRHDFYRPLVYGRLEAGLDGDGRPVAWAHDAVSQSILSRFRPQMTVEGHDRTSTEGAANVPYGIANLRVRYAMRETPVPVGFWRSVGSSQNAFITESFIDEIAHAGGRDPYELRRELLGGEPRHKAVLERLAEMSGWGSELPKRWGRGIAVHECFGSIVGEVAEVEVSTAGEIRVHRVVCVVDCGEIVNTDTIVAQMESGIIYGLTAALYGKISIERGAVVESNFHDYHMLRLADCPRIETYIMDSTEASGGVGEPGTPPIAPAVTNAIFAATGKRIRDLPIADHDLSA